VATCRALLERYDEAQEELEIVLASRAIAEAGSGLPLTSWAPLGRVGRGLPDKAWRWLAGCANAGDAALAVIVAMFAVEWDEVGPSEDWSDPPEIGLLKPQHEALATILTASVLRAPALSRNLEVWHAQGRKITVGVAQRGHCRVLLDLCATGSPVDPEALAVARALAGPFAADGSLPTGISNRMAEYGRARYRLEYDTFEPGPFDERLGELAPDLLARWIVSLRSVVLPAGSWAVYGAAETLMRTVADPPESATDDYAAIIDASLEFQRRGGVWKAALSPRETMHWDQRHPGETWLARQFPPSRDAVEIQPLDIGGERKLTMFSHASDGRAMIVRRPSVDAYVITLDYVDDETGERKRDDRASFPSLYDAYLDFGQNALPGVWVDPELERFLTFPMPTLE
jgi:hypothetical protein